MKEKEDAPVCVVEPCSIPSAESDGGVLRRWLRWRARAFHGDKRQTKRKRKWWRIWEEGRMELGFSRRISMGLKGRGKEHALGVVRR
jgi:hypothetical protein